MKEYNKLVRDRNSQIKHIDEMNSILEYELADLHSKTESHEAQISQLSEQIRELQMDSKVQLFILTHILPM